MQTKVRGLNSDGNEVDVKASDTGGLVVASEGGFFDQAVSRGSVYLTASQTTVVTQAGLSATTPALTIANRIGSGKYVKIWHVAAGSLVSATACAQVWACLGAYSTTAVTETTAATVVNAKTGASGNPDGIGCCAVATLPAAPVAVMQLGAQTSAAVTLTTNGFCLSEWINGAIWVPEGCNFTIQTSTASTLFCSYVFEVVAA